LNYAGLSAFSIKVVSGIYIPIIKRWVSALQPIKYEREQFLAEI